MQSSFPSSAPRRVLTTLFAGVAVLISLMQPAVAATPVTPEFGPLIEDPTGYVGQKRCKPKPKPGLLAFQDLLQTTYPDSTWFGISRGCEIGGTSEHKEGRAIDWSRDATDRAQRKSVSQLLAWLLAEDQYGNENAMARRLGVMYVIWNRRMWSSWDQEWEIYCVQKRKKCKDPDSKSALHPHDDHVHFSFGWAGARKQTSFWNPELSHGDPQPSPSPSGSPPPDGS